MRSFLHIGLFILGTCHLSAQLTRDTFYPGFDIGIESVEMAKKEVSPGLGVKLFVKIVNAGASPSLPFIIRFWVSSNDDFEADKTLITTKEVRQFKANSIIEFEKLVVIPDDYKEKFAYIFTQLDFSDSPIQDIKPTDNIMMTGIRIGERLSNYVSNIRFETEMLDLSFKPKRRKVKRSMNYNLSGQTIVTNLLATEEKLYLQLVLSKDKKLDDTDKVFGSIKLPTIVNDQSIAFDGQVTIPDFLPRGKAYMYGRLTMSNSKDLAPEKNQTVPVRIKIR